MTEKSKTMKNQFESGFSALILLLVLGLFVGVGLYVYMNYVRQSPELDNDFSQTGGEVTNVVGEYTFMIPKDKKASAGLYQDLETARRIEIESIFDTDPANRGFVLVVLENSSGKSFQELCSVNEYIDEEDFNGSCDFEALETEPVVINGLTWDKITNTSVPYNPSGYVTYVLSSNNYIYYVVDSVGDQDQEIVKVLETFELFEH